MASIGGVEEDGKEPKGVFPALDSPQRASVPAAGTRQKVQLTVGHSLLDWIRLGNSGKDLTGVGGMKGVVYDDELALHNKENDAWTCVRGLVYNITPYLDFHPGGRDYLMKGAGIDATDLFNSYHQWVNAESMLGKCLIGKLKKRVSVDPSVVKADNKVKKPSEQKFLTPKPPTQSGPPRYEWFQQEDRLMIVVYSRWPGLRAKHCTIDYDETSRQLRLTMCIKGKYYLLNLALDDQITNDGSYQLKVNEKVGKVDVVLTKKEARKWNGVGRPLPDNGVLFELKDLMAKEDLGYRIGRIGAIQKLTHDVNLYRIDVPKTTRMPIALGQHVYIEYKVENTSVQRPYTVVDSTLWNGQNADVSKEEFNVNDHFFLMVKTYGDGLFTSALGKMNVNDELSISVADGPFDVGLLLNRTKILMYAAGTGLTPMIRIVNHVLSKDNSVLCRLVFFNKTEKDIVWREEFDALAQRDKRFEIVNVLSQEDSWAGLKGRICPEILDSTMSDSEYLDSCLVLICGPSVFTQLGLKLFKEKGIKDENVHAFLS